MLIQLQDLAIWQTGLRTRSRYPSPPKALDAQKTLNEGIRSIYQTSLMISEKYRSVTWAA